jgi:hypothetical protein
MYLVIKQGVNVKRIHFLVLILVLLISGFSAANGQALVDKVKFNKAVIVLRVRLLSNGKAIDKYAWSVVRILKVYKNDSGVRLGKTIPISFYGGELGIPEGTCTVYLERYNPKRKDFWKLLNGSGREGTSHLSRPINEKINR